MSNEAHTPDNVDPKDGKDERKAYASPVCYAHEFESALAERAGGDRFIHHRA